MPTEIDRHELLRLVGEGARLVEVLPREEFEEMHLPGALNMPLKELPGLAAELDREQPVIAYCWDSA